MCGARRSRLALLLLAWAGTAPAADPVAGKFWYEQRCARCHGSPPQERQAGTPNITGRSAERIRHALAQVPAMSRVELADTQVLEVEAYLQAPLDYLWAPGVDFSDTWYDPREPGWGMTLTQHPSARVVVFLYLYDSAGRPLWLMGSALQWLAPTQLRGPLLRVGASGFDAASFDSTSVRLSTVGNIDLQFRDAQRATLRFDIDGVMYQREISRLAY